MRTGGGVCLPLSIPSTGSMPIKAENFKVVRCFLRAKANEVLPPRLWPASASLLRFALTRGGSKLWSPSDNQFVIAVVDLISSLESGPATVYNCSGQGRK